MSKICRGKRVDNEKWVRGYFVKKIDPLLRTVMCFILVQEYDKSCIDGTPTTLRSEMTWYRVIPETVGLCTDLPDKNGKIIFEDDIFVSPENPKVKSVVYWGEDTASFEWFCGDGLGVDNKDVEIVGNVHDNPEMLVK